MPEGNLLVTLTLNPAIDRLIEIDNFRYGEMNRITCSRNNIAGKGYHAALSNYLLGGESFCLGISFKNTRVMTEHFFIANSVPNEFVEVSGDLRVNLKILDRKKKKITEINDRGAEINKKDLESLINLFRKYLSEAKMFVFAGSLPPGVYPEIYRDLIAEASAAGCKTVLDAEGLPLVKGLESVPDFVKANTYEIYTTFGKKIKSPEDAAKMCLEINNKGVGIACITLGTGGAVISGSGKAYYAVPPSTISTVATVGTGAVLIGAVCNEILKGSSVKNMLISGVAAASARVVSDGSRFFSPETYREIREKVIISQVKI